MQLSYIFPLHYSLSLNLAALVLVIDFASYCSIAPKLRRMKWWKIALFCQICEGGNQFWEQNDRKIGTYRAWIARQLIAHMQGKWKTLVADCSNLYDFLQSGLNSNMIIRLRRISVFCRNLHNFLKTFIFLWFPLNFNIYHEYIQWGWWFIKI